MTKTTVTADDFQRFINGDIWKLLKGELQEQLMLTRNQLEDWTNPEIKLRILQGRAEMLREFMAAPITYMEKLREQEESPNDTDEENEEPTEETENEYDERDYFVTGES